jgi:molybdopterin converting factor small subunit
MRAIATERTRLYNISRSFVQLVEEQRKTPVTSAVRRLMGEMMTVQMEISPIFGKYVDNRLNVTLEGGTIGEALQDLKRQHPDAGRVFLDREGKLLHSYEIYVNGESVYPLKMDIPLKDGDKLTLLMIIQGG